jgi:sugar fermentation stimulation protein A
VAAALKRRRIAELADYRNLRREVRYGQNSRVDFLLTQPGLPDCYLEVKNATWPGTDDAIAFPDAVTLRGQKHLRELASRVRSGDRAVLLFLANRPHGSFVRACHERDPSYAKALLEAHRAGVEILAYPHAHRSSHGDAGRALAGPPGLTVACRP